jgi:response regulator of citrate/malate metabolism
MTKQCLIVDDEPPAHTILENYIGQVDALLVAGKCYSAMEALNFLHQHKTDIILT